MTLSQLFLAELEKETIATKKMLSRMPFDKQEWRPHEKSMPLGRLCVHIAELPQWVSTTISQDDLDWLKTPYNPFQSVDLDELLVHFDKISLKAKEDLASCTDEIMQRPWTMRRGEQVFFTAPKHVVIRDMCFNHLVHHRGQLSVYFRLLDIALPPVYGPTADER